MECPTDIHHYNTLLQEDRVYTFLDGLDDRLDNIRSDVLQMRPFPSIEQAYAHVRREALRQAVMSAGDPDLTSGAVLTTKGLKLSPALSSSGAASSQHTGRPTVTPRSRTGGHTPLGTKCSYCGNQRHTSDNCFKKVSYPDWWYELQAKKKQALVGSNASTGKMAVVSAESHLSLIPHTTSQVAGPASDIGNVGSGLATSSCDGDRGAWLLDSGATDHMTFVATDFTTTSSSRHTSVANANGVVSPVTGAGSVSLSPSLQLSHTLLVPSLSHKLLSVSQVIAELNCVVLIYPTFCLLQDILTKEIIARDTNRGGLYYMEDVCVGHVFHLQGDGKERQIWLWHRRLGHPNFGYLKHLLPDLFPNKVLSDLKCNICIVAKSHRTSYLPSMNKSIIPFALVHSDVWGPSPIYTGSGIRWFVTFIDDCTRMTWLYLLKHKDDVFSVFEFFHAMIQTQFSAKLQVICSDNGGEYVNQRFLTYFNHHGLIHETSCPQTPQQNGVAEWKNRHILETARALLHRSHVPTRYWPDAVSTVVHLLNRLPSKVLHFKTPLQVLVSHASLPTTLMLPPRVFDCVAYVHLHQNQRTKLDPCALRCIFLGYDVHQKGYKCYNPLPAAYM